MEVTIVAVAVIAYIAFRNWLQQSRRAMIHRERLAAIEKGIDLPPLEQEIQKSSFNVQRFLLLAGLVWISVGAAAFVTLSALLAYPSEVSAQIPRGIQWIGLAPGCIGLSHLIVYAIGKKKEGGK